MPVAKRRSRKKPSNKPGCSRWGFGWHESVRTVKFVGTGVLGFLSGFGGLFLTSDNAQRLISTKGFWASLGLIGMGVCKIVYELQANNCPEQADKTADK